MQRIFLKALNLLIVCFVASSNVYSWDKLTRNLDLHCQQDKKQLFCQYRSLTNKNPKTFEASLGNKSLPVNQTDFSKISEPIAVLFVVDTSDPNRQNVIEKNKQHIESIIQNHTSGFEFGLAAFDKTFRIEAPIGQSDFLLKKQLKQLKAIGQTTELYRNVLSALQYLDQHDAKRKVIVLLSDGQAEDRAYFNSDVVKFARNNSIVINSIGYPRSVSLSVALQTLRRLSEETGGTFFETKTDFEITDTYINTAFNNLKTGGQLSIDLENTVALKTGNSVITLVIDNQSFNIPVRLPKPAVTTSPVTETTPIKTQTEQTDDLNTAPVTIVTRQIESQPVNLWIWYGIPAAFIIIIILILITLFLLWQRPTTRSKTSAKVYEYKPYAYLIDNDNDNKRYPIMRTISRIGRSKDNELILDDASISRRHAEMHRNATGGFEIIDMNSMNGVYVNGEKIGRARLQEGDEVEVGDIVLKFSLYAPDQSEEESTIMQKTKTPEISIS